MLFVSIRRNGSEPGKIFVFGNSGKRKYFMMTSSNENIFRVTALCEGNPPVTDESPHKGQWRGALVFSLICAWTYGWVNNRDAGDLRHHRAHYDVIVTCKHSSRWEWVRASGCVRKQLKKKTLLGSRSAEVVDPCSKACNRVTWMSWNNIGA